MNVVKGARLSDLPLKPDPRAAGEPRPPRAPAYRDDDDENAKTRDIGPGRKPELPTGQGPVLAWYQVSRRHTWSALFWGMGMVIVGGVLLSWLRNGEIFLDEFPQWEVWLGAVVLATPVALATRRDKCSAGFEWVRGKSKCVRVYELTSIKVKYYGDGSTELHLDDHDGRHLEIDRKMLPSDRLIWDLVYNGILHSAVQGARVDRKAQRAWQLPVTPKG